MEIKFRRNIKGLMLSDLSDGEGEVVPIISDGEDGDLEDVDVPDSIPILSLRNTVLFPGGTSHLNWKAKVDTTY
jgi:ATP-dependent Lon protease